MLTYLRSPRIAEITKAYFCATATAGFAISTIFALMAAISAKDVSMLGLAALLAFTFSVFTIPYTLVLTALPAVGIITLAEWRGISSPWFYAAMGALAAAAAVLTVTAAIQLTNGGTVTNWPATVVSFASIILLLAVPGVVGGLTYWAKAGRDAG